MNALETVLRSRWAKAFCVLGVSGCCFLGPSSLSAFAQEPLAYPSNAWQAPSDYVLPATPDSGFVQQVSFGEYAPTIEPASQDAPVPEAQEAPAEDFSTMTARLDDLEKQIAQLGEKPKVNENEWKVKLGGHVQSEYIMWSQTDPAITDASDYFEFRRLRLVADGTGYGFLDFRLQMTLEPETVGSSPAGTVTSPDVKDAYLSLNDLPFFQRIRFGNFFVPFSLEQVTNDTNNIFLERSIPTQGIFAVDREVGAAMYGQNEDYRVTWAFGTFFDSISEGLKERIDDNQGNRVSGRVTWLPYYECEGRYLLHTGFGILHTHDQDKSLRIRARPQVHEGPRLMDSGAIATNTYTTGNVELAWVQGPFTLQSEAFISQINQINGQESYMDGCYAHGSYFLTGENRVYQRFGQHGAQFGRNEPIVNFDPRHGHGTWGAWELKSRWSYLNLDEFNAGQYNDLTVGFNWYWNDRTRWMFDWIHPVTSSDAAYGATASDLLGLRLDYNW